jgi:hypothetical protein
MWAPARSKKLKGLEVIRLRRNLYYIDRIKKAQYIYINAVPNRKSLPKLYGYISKS